MTDNPHKMPGILKDPWRTSDPDVPSKEQLARVERKEARKPRHKAEQGGGLEEVHEDLQDTRYSTIELKNYGGITVSGTNSVRSAASQILAFVVDHFKGGTYSVTLWDRCC